MGVDPAVVHGSRGATRADRLAPVTYPISAFTVGLCGATLWLAVEDEDGLKTLLDRKIVEGLKKGDDYYFIRFSTKFFDYWPKHRTSLEY